VPFRIKRYHRPINGTPQGAFPTIDHPFSRDAVIKRYHRPINGTPQGAFPTIDHPFSRDAVIVGNGLDRSLQRRQNPKGYFQGGNQHVQGDKPCSYADLFCFRWLFYSNFRLLTPE